MLNILKKIIGQNKNTNESNIYCGLAFKEDEGNVMLLRVEGQGGSVSVIEERNFKYTDSWKMLVDDIDAVLYELEKAHDVRCENAILFIYSHLIDQEKKTIREPYKEKINDVLKQLELKQTDIIEYHQAIAQHASAMENAPLTAVVVEIDRPAVSAFLYQGGLMINQSQTARTDNITADLEKIFTDLKGDYLPTRVILYDSSSFEDESSKILTHNWPDKLFIHIPNVDIFGKDKQKDALLAGFRKKLLEEVTVVAPVVKDSENEQAEKMIPVAAQVSGFVVGEDIGQMPSPPATVDSAIAHEPMAKNFNQSLVDKFRQRVSAFQLNQISVFNQPSSVILAVLGLILIFGSIFILLKQFHKAHITVLYESIPIEKNVTMEAVVGGGDNLDVFNLTKHESTFKESAKTTTTGKKTIGEKAKGQATILNLDETEHTFRKGAILTSDTGIKFILDEDVKVASASSSTTSEGDVKITTGKKTANATAADIGEKSNIAKDTKLTIEGTNSTSIRTLAETAFSGGTQEEIRTVAREDQDKLLKDIENKVKKKADAEVKKQSEKMTLVKDLTQLVVKQKKFSKEISEEAAEVTLSATYAVNYYTYDETKLKDKLQKEIASETPPNFILTLDDISYKINSVKKAEKSGKITLTIAAVGIPRRKLDEAAIRKLLVGKTHRQVDVILKEKFAADGFQMDVQAPISILHSRLPFFKNNIQVEVGTL